MPLWGASPDTTTVLGPQIFSQLFHMIGSTGITTTRVNMQQVSNLKPGFRWRAHGLHNGRFRKDWTSAHKTNHVPMVVKEITGPVIEFKVPIYA